MTYAEYLKSLNPAARREVRKLRAAIRAAAPGAVDGISYGIPCIKLNDRPVVWYAGWKEHTSMYPVGTPFLRAYAIDPKGYKISKGTMRFPLTNPPSAAFVKRLVTARLTQFRRES